MWLGTNHLEWPQATWRKHRTRAPVPGVLALRLQQHPARTKAMAVIAHKFSTMALSTSLLRAILPILAPRAAEISMHCSQILVAVRPPRLPGAAEGIQGEEEEDTRVAERAQPHHATDLLLRSSKLLTVCCRSSNPHVPRRHLTILEPSAARSSKVA